MGTKSWGAYWVVGGFGHTMLIFSLIDLYNVTAFWHSGVRPCPLLLASVRLHLALQVSCVSQPAMGTCPLTGHRAEVNSQMVRCLCDDTAAHEANEESSSLIYTLESWYVM